MEEGFAQGQMAGQLQCEFAAPDQDTFLRLLDKHHIAYEWSIRAELTWGEPLAAGVSTRTPLIVAIVRHL
jgi:hypothetical protein